MELKRTLSFADAAKGLAANCLLGITAFRAEKRDATLLVTNHIY
jgi:hypothetical protein